MSTIHIEWLSDSHDCETCGVSYSSGARVTINGALALDLVPTAHCYDGDHWERDAVYRAILVHLGHSVTTDDDVVEAEGS